MDVILGRLFQQNDRGKRRAMVARDVRRPTPGCAVAHGAARVRTHRDAVVVHRNCAGVMAPQSCMRAFARAGMSDENDALPVVVNAGGVKDQAIAKMYPGAQEQLSRTDVEQTPPLPAGAPFDQRKVVPRGVGAQYALRLRRAAALS